MENRKDIGKIISEKLDSLDKTPNEKVWIGINEEIQQKKKKRRLAFFFFWTKTLGVFFIGAVIAFFIYHQNDGFDFGLPNNSKDKIIINNENGATNATNPNTIKNNQKQNTKSILDNNTAKTAKDDSNLNINNNPVKTDKSEKSSKKIKYNNPKNSSEINSTKNNSNTTSSKSAKGKSKFDSKKSFSKKRKDKSIKEQRKLLSSENNTIKKDSVVVDLTELQNKKSIESTSKIKAKKTDSLIAKKGKEKTININMYPKDSLKTDSTRVYRKFYIDAFISPTYYGSFTKESVLDRDLDTLTKKLEIKFSFGFGLTYDLTETISIRIGYSKVNLNYITKNAPIGVNMSGAENFSGISYNANTSNATIFAASNGSEKMDITQKISYTEIPIAIKYTFLNKKIGLKSSLGFSYLLLDENKISIKTLNGYTQDIGKTKNLSDTSFSVNVGVEIDYPLFKNTKIFVEPLLNYQIKAFNGNDLQPYIFGIHTGIRYSINNK